MTMKHNIEQILEEYNVRKENANMLIDEIKYIIHEAIKNKPIKIHYVSDRIKPFDSFLDKIKRKDLKDPFNEVHDLIGLRIICLFLEDISKVGDLITQGFDVFDVEKKIEESGIDVFGYMASHYKARLKKDTTFDGMAKNYSFEIQVRTIAQDAWASISHYLFYKHDIFLPDNLKRDFHALSGLFYISDTHFSLLRDEQLKYLLKETEWQKNDAGITDVLKKKEKN